jgi:pimeloyl-ACP methyl ester carboxylesterase
MRRFLQPAQVVNKIPYGNNLKAGHYVQSNDAKIYYEVYGKGKPIVLLHGGLFGSTIEYAQLIDSLKWQYKVIAISTRGHGKSEIGTEPLTLDQRARDVLAVVNSVTKEKVMIVGFSDGGFTAYTFASSFPEKVERMVVIGAGILYPGLREFNMSYEKGTELDKIYWKQQRAIMPQPERLEELFIQIANCYSKVTVGKELLGSIKCPVLVMAGDRDDGNSVQNVLNAALLISNHQLAIIPNAGHTALNENFNAAWAGMAPFIKGQ